MLEPQTRRLLLDCLQPPEGFELSQAIGTTFSLDLDALLSLPVAFAFREAMGEEGGADPLATLEALRRHADRLHLFCQAGQIHVPTGQQRLFAYLEQSVIPVSPAGGAGVFHPKTWLLRFTRPDKSVGYRFICLSRNLTFDRSWDTALVLDGELRRGRGSNPSPVALQRFIEHLPRLAHAPVPERTRAAVELAAAELPRVHFELPEHVESLQFQPMGIPNWRGPKFEPWQRPLLVVSPFLAEDWLHEHVGWRQAACLVSRDDQLQGLSPEALALFDEHFTVSEDASPEEAMEEQAEHADLVEGLHAKLFVMDDGHKAHVWTGSANATSAAFRHNVEFLVQLTGMKSKLGIDTLMRPDEREAGFRELLERWHPPEVEAEAPDPLAERLERRLDAARRALAHADLEIAAGAEQDGQFPLTVDGDWPALGDNVTGRLWPVGLDHGHAKALSGQAVDFGLLTLEAVSAFVAVELTAAEQGRSQSTRFVLRLPLTGLPGDREQRLLRALLTNRREFMRLLMILLADDGVEAVMAAAADEPASGGGNWLPGEDDAPLLESLLKSLDRAPERLDQIQRLLDDLGDGRDLDELLPAGFMEVWQAVWANREAALADD